MSDNLPPLPETVYGLFYEAQASDDDEGYQELFDEPAFTADQMKTYASAAIEADRVSRDVPAGMVLVPQSLIDEFPEINPSNYDHDDACELNRWGCEVVTTALAASPQPQPVQASGYGPKLVPQASGHDKPVQAQSSEAFLLRDLSDEIGVEAPRLSSTLTSLGHGNYSTNMEVPEAAANAARFYFQVAQPKPANQPTEGLNMEAHEIVVRWAEQNHTKFVSRSAGQYTTDTVSKHSLEDLVTPLLARIAELESKQAALEHALADCREAFRTPSEGSNEERSWREAMGDPECVPGYVRASIAALTAQVEQAAQPVAGLVRCEFDDECDFCKTPSGGTFTRLTHNAEDVTEAEFYICGDCVSKAVTGYTTQSKAEPITYERLHKVWESDNGLEDCDMRDLTDFNRVVRFVEYLHGITNSAAPTTQQAAQRLYPAPPKAVPLTDEQINEMWKAPMSADWEHREFARAIEAHHGITPATVEKDGE